MFSPDDVALVLKYHFSLPSFHSREPDHGKKRKLAEPKRLENVLDYSFIKLPATMFLNYLKNDIQHFLTSCER